MKYKFRQYKISAEMVDAIKRYTDNKVQPGEFLTHIICNDPIRDCIESADSQNMANLPAFLAYFVNEAPSQCWGSREKMEAWLSEK
jgi:hypothetical protein